MGVITEYNKCVVLMILSSFVTACVEDGLEPLCFECDDDICGFWRFKEDENQTSVYQSTHIDTDRDLNSYGT